MDVLAVGLAVLYTDIANRSTGQRLRSRHMKMQLREGERKSKGNTDKRQRWLPRLRVT